MSTHMTWFASLGALGLIACGDGFACSGESGAPSAEAAPAPDQSGSSVSVSLDDKGGSVDVTSKSGDSVSLQAGGETEK